jgi:hypothetical protein
VVSKDLTTSGRPVSVPQLGPEARLVLDVALGVAGVTVGAAVVAVRTVNRVAAPLTRMLWRPPLVPTRFHPATVFDDLARSGGADRDELHRRAEVLLDAWLPALVATVVERLDLTRLVEDNVDLDGLVATVDLDAAVARVDLDAAVARVDLDAAVARVDVDAVVARADLDGAVALVDLDAVVSRVDIDAILKRVDLDEVAARLDIDAILNRVDLDEVAARLDVDAVVARADLDAVVNRIDLDAVAAKLDVDAVVARADLDAVVNRIDLDAVAAKLDVDAVVARADLDAVIDRLDVIGIVEEVLEVIDLPAIIRDSTGSMASETVRGVRMTGITADDALSRAVDRALFRRRQRQTPQEPPAPPAPPAVLPPVVIP